MNYFHNNFFTQIDFVNALTPKEISLLNSKYLELGLYIKQIVVDSFGYDIETESKKKNLLGRKRLRKKFNSLDEFLSKYFEEDSSMTEQNNTKENTTNSNKKRTQKYSNEDIKELIHSLNSIKEECKKIEYKFCKNEDIKYKSTIIDYIIKYKNYIKKEEYSMLVEKWKNELFKIKGIDVLNFNQVNDFLNWKTPILKALKSEMILYSICNVCEDLIQGKKKAKNNMLDKQIKKIKKDENKNESSESENTEEDYNAFNHDDALIIQLQKNANGDDEI